MASTTADLHREEWTSGGEPLDLTSNPHIHLMAWWSVSDAVDGRRLQVALLKVRQGGKGNSGLAKWRRRYNKSAAGEMEKRCGLGKNTK